MVNYVDFRNVLYTIEEHKKVADGCLCYTKEISDMIHNQLIEAVKIIPAADVVPVRHGRWIRHTDTRFGSKLNDCIECNCCGIWFSSENQIRRTYCPNCGARMDD